MASAGSPQVNLDRPVRGHYHLPWGSAGASSPGQRLLVTTLMRPADGIRVRQERERRTETSAGGRPLSERLLELGRSAAGESAGEPGAWITGCQEDLLSSPFRLAHAPRVRVPCLRTPMGASACEQALGPVDSPVQGTPSAKPTSQGAGGDVCPCGG
jgi:hypothetical protein